LPASGGNDADSVGNFPELVPYFAADSLELVDGVENPIGKALLIDKVERPLDRVELGAIKRKADERQVAVDFETYRAVQARAIKCHPAALA